MAESPRKPRTWLLRTVIIVAAVVVVAAIIYTVATGQRFF